MPDKQYFEIIWETTERHRRKFTAKELADLLRIDPADLNPKDPEENSDLSLCNVLAEVEGNESYDGVTMREDINVTVLRRPPGV